MQLSWYIAKAAQEVHIWGRVVVPLKAGSSLKLGKMYVYILYSGSLNRYYVGQTADIKARLIRHNRGLVSFTKRGVPWDRVWMKKVENRSEAVLFERRIKGRGAKRYLQDIGM